MKLLPIKMCFKGLRDYLHSTDMYNAILENALKEGPGGKYISFRLVMHSLAHKQCDMILGEPGENIPKPKNSCAEFILSSDGGNVMGWLVETERDVDCRIAFNEEKIEELCEINKDERSIMIKGDSGYSSMEVVISMTKQLHYAIFPSQDKWFVTKVELQRLLAATDSYQAKIELKHNFNNQLTKSELKINRECIGYIYFSLLKNDRH